MLIMLAAAALQLPAYGQLLAPEDYPAAAQTHELSAAAVVDLLIDPQGRVIGCDTRSTAGDAGLGEQICGITLNRRVAPARLRDGTPSYGAVHTALKLFLTGTKQGDFIHNLQHSPALELSVKHLPDGAARMEGALLLAVDAQGVVTDCEPLAKAGKPSLPPALCKYDGLSPQPVEHGKDGVAVGYITNLQIALIAPAPGIKP